jgi:hypothetical protein
MNTHPALARRIVSNESNAIEIQKTSPDPPPRNTAVATLNAVQAAPANRQDPVASRNRRFNEELLSVSTAMSCSRWGHQASRA